MQIYTFKSGVSTFLVLFISLPITAIIILAITQHKYWLAAGFALFLFILLKFIHSFRYKITHDSLVISWLFAKNIEIPLDQIKDVKETNDPWSSPAASFDRLSIKYGNNSRIIISPHPKEEFISALQSRCPNLKVDEKIMEK